MASQRDLDLIVWGATGFTGELATAYLTGDASKIFSWPVKSAAAPSDLKWAIAGRSRSKLEALNAGVEIIVCDSSDEVAIKCMVSRTRVVVGFAGPFVKYSDKVVEACVRSGTHWCDICGEVDWHRSLIDRFGYLAKATGACIVSHCGYDSVPSDLGTLFAVNALRSRFADPSLKVKSVMVHQIMQGGMSGGTLQTGLARETNPISLTKGVDLDDVFLIGGETVNGVRPEDKPETKAYFDEDLQAWLGPFMMAGINTRVVRRSSMLLGYGPNYNYREVMICPNEKAAKKAEKEASPNKVPPAVIEKMIEAGRLPKPGQGPSPEVRAKSRFLSAVIATAENGESIACTLSGHEAGYEQTACMAIEAGLSLVYESAACPGINSGGGFLTPAACMGTVLINRLQRAGMNFEILPAGAPASQRVREKIGQFSTMLSKL
eukprot:TRINITY_DN69299_c0_g1_i1.p1 TRINITY_DN69299_c0_g1~~TRINITY_DN69299_c0_g1_i1.p1  ORF type:complete len:455 (+),score=76.85 TRINITY_DN69299_c0_g1_i1:64-1365(+)